MTKLIIAFLILMWFTLIGASCETIPTRTVDNVTITKNLTPVEILHPPLPEPVTWEEFKWTVITPSLMKSLLEKYNNGELAKKDLVFFGITAEGYENLSTNMAEIIRYIEGQKSVIIYYRTTVPDKFIMEEE